MNNDKIINRVKNLLAMAADSSSPEEAAIAANRARILMDKHQISKDDAEQFKKDKFASQATSDDWKNMPRWKSMLALSISKFNDCIATIEASPNNQWRKCIMFKGYESDAIIANAMFDYLCTTIDRHVKVEEAKGMTGRGSKNSFRLGAVFALIERIDTMTEARIKEEQKNYGDVGQALMVVKRKEVGMHFGKQRQAKTRVNINDNRARNAGAEAGRKISLNPQVTGSASTKKLSYA